jgi:hypothetical protein
VFYRTALSSSYMKSPGRCENTSEAWTGRLRLYEREANREGRATTLDARSAYRTAMLLNQMLGAG